MVIKHFTGCTNLSNLEFTTRAVKVIGPYAFYGTGINSLTIPKSSKCIIQKQAFRNCTNLKEIRVYDDSIKYIEDGVFAYCTNLKKLTNGGYYEWGEYRPSTFDPDNSGTCGLFEGCSSLEYFDTTGLVLSEGNMGENTFYNCINLKNIRFNFFNSSLNPFTVIKSGMFVNCTSLTDLRIPNTITKIENNSFGGTDVSITMNITYEGSASNWRAIENVGYTQNGAPWIINGYVNIYCSDGSSLDYYN